jgi:hypothetical protein
MIHSPILIIGCARSGTTLLYNILSEIPGLWSIGYESKDIIEKYHHPSVKNWDSGALDSGDLTQQSRSYMISEFEKQSASGKFWGMINQFRNILRNSKILSYVKSQGRSSSITAELSSALPQRGLDLIRKFVRFRNGYFPFLLPKKIQLLEKTPENCLRLSFMLELFPDAKVIYLVRDGRANVYSLMEGWKQPYLFPGYQIPTKVSIPGDTRGRWAFTLIPGWRELLNRPLEEVCAWQWVQSNQSVLDFLENNKGAFPHVILRYEDLICNSGKELGKISRLLDPSGGEIRLPDCLPNINVVSAPDPNKWRKYQSEIENVYPIINTTLEMLGYKI